MQSRSRWLVGGAGGLALLAVALAYRHDLRAARTRVATGATRLQTDRGPIEVAVRGEGPPVLLVHGAGGGWDQGMDIGENLVDRGLRVIAVSRFGYLGTPLPADASAEAQADAHAGVLDALHVERAAIVGASAGAPSAVQFALLHPERTAALVLLVPALGTSSTGRAGGTAVPRFTQLAFDTALRWDFLFWALRRLAPRMLVEALLGTPPSVLAAAAPAERARVTRLLDHILPVSRRADGLLNDARIVSSLRPDTLERIAAPTLAISVADDLYGTDANAREAARRIPGARYLGWPQGGHVFVSHEAEVTDAVASFVLAHR